MSNQYSFFKYPVNTILFTRDGRVIGNSIVIAHEFGARGAFLTVVKTDYGNNMSFTDKDIESIFWPIDKEIQAHQNRVQGHKHWVK